MASQSERLQCNYRIPTPNERYRRWRNCKRTGVVIPTPRRQLLEVRCWQHTPYRDADEGGGEAYREHTAIG